MNRKILLIVFLIILIGLLAASLFSVYLSIETRKKLAFYKFELDDVSMQINNPTDRYQRDIDLNLEFIRDNVQSIEELKEEQNKYKTVLLDTSAKGYNRIDTDNGTFLISFLDAKPHLDGYKLIFNIGNTTSATYDGFTINVVWGKQYEEWAKESDIKKEKIDTNVRFEKLEYDEWAKSLHKKSESYLKELKPGYWNKVEVIISPAEKDELGYLALSMETSMETSVVSLIKGK